MKCGSELNCSYNGVNLKGTAKGPLLSTQKNGEVSLVKVSTNKEQGGFLCPESSKLDLTTTPLAATYLTRYEPESTVLCVSDTTTCGSPLTHVHETSVSKTKLLTTLLTVECDVLFLGNTVAKTSEPLIIEGNFTYSNCGSCTATEENGPAEIKVLKLGHETADVTGEGLVHVVCGSDLDCAYNGVGLIATAKGPLLAIQTNGEVSMLKQSAIKEAGGFLCTESSKLDLTTTPLSATYITR